jgi:hypothetical protein
MFLPSKILPAFWPALSLAVGCGFVYGLVVAHPGAEIQYVAVDDADADGCSLHRVRQAPLDTELLANAAGRTAHLVVCEGLAYWAVNETNMTRLYRSRYGSNGIDLINTYSGMGVYSAHLETDGHVVYWCTQRQGGGGLLHFGSNRSSNMIYAGGFSDTAKELCVVGQEAYLATEAPSEPTPRVMVSRSRPGSGLTTLLGSANAIFSDMASDGVHLWVLLTQLGTNPSRSRLHMHQLGSVGFPVKQDIYGVGKQVAARNGQVVWSVNLPDNQGARLYTRMADGLNTTQLPFTDVMDSLGIRLTDNHGLWWGNVPGGTRIRAFDLFNYQTHDNSMHPPSTLVSSAQRGEDLVLSLQSSDSSPHRVVAYQPINGALVPRSAGFYDQPVRALGAGRWDVMLLSGEKLVRKDHDHQTETKYLVSGTAAQFAFGNESPRGFIFAANQAPQQRKLYRYDQGNITPLGNPALESGEDYQPRDFYTWNDRVWMSVEGGTGRVLASLPAEGYSPFAEEWHRSPSGFQEFKGRLLFQEDSEPREEGPTGRRNAVRLRYGQIDYIGNPSGSAPSGVLAEYAGRVVYLEELPPHRLKLVSLDGPEELVPYPQVSAKNPDPMDFLGWKGNLVYHYATLDGKRQLACLRQPGGGSFPICDADSFGPILAHRGYLFFVAFEGGQEILYRVDSINGVPHPVENLTSMGLGGLRALHAHGSLVYGAAEWLGGTVAVAFTAQTFQVLPPSEMGQLDGFIDFRSFQGSLYLRTRGAGSNFWRLDFSTWVPVHTSTLQDADEFSEYAGALYFTASVDGKRDLYRKAGDVTMRLDPSLPVTSGFNPRALQRFQDSLLFSAQTGTESRELCKFGAFLPPGIAVLSQIGSGHMANPLVDGPRNIQLSVKSILENLPAGLSVGLLTAEDHSSDGPVFLGIEEGFWPSFLFSVEANQLKLAQPSSRGYGFNLDLPIRATNAQGIWNRQIIPLEIVDNREAWLTQHFPGEEGNFELTGDDQDPDGDGITNIRERAFGLNPRGGSFAAGLPRAAFALVDEDPESTRLQITFETPLSFPSRLSYLVYASGDLMDWQYQGELQAGGFGEVIWNGMEDELEAEMDVARGVIRYYIRDQVDMKDAPKRFLRLEVNPW